MAGCYLLLSTSSGPLSETASDSKSGALRIGFVFHESSGYDFLSRLRSQ